MSKITQDVLRDTVNQVLSLGQHPDGIWDEISSLETLSEPDFCSSITGLSCVPALKNGAAGSQCGEGEFSMSQCAKRLRRLASQIDSQGLQVIQQPDLQRTVLMVKQVMQSGIFRQRQFCQMLLKDGPLPVTLVWRLCKEGVISMENFLQIRGCVTGFVPSFVGQLRGVVKEEGGTKCLADILTELMYLVDRDRKPGKSGVDVKKISCTVIDQLVLGLVDAILADSVTDDDTNIVEAFCQVAVDLEVFNKTAAHLLTVMLCYKPAMKVSTAVKEQVQWSYGKMNPCLAQLYKQLLLGLDVAGVLELLHGILEQHEVNWRLLLSLVSVTVVCMPESSRLFLEFLDKLLHDSLENCDRESTLTGLLLARQACLQGPHVFMSYADWCQRTLADSSRSLVNNRKSFTFLMKLLTDLVPYESAQHIRVHISCPPLAPAKCRQMITDYVCLAKTRLEDLKETVDLPGQEQKGSSKSADSDELETAVTSAVGLFESSGKVPTSVLEASIFRKPYYIGQFLPALLKPRPLPDRPDSRVNFITALVKADKIPQTMYNNYTKACKKEAMQLLAGVFVDLDSDDEMELSPLEQFENSLQHFGSTVTALSGAQCKPKLTEAVSQVCERLEAVLAVKSHDQKAKVSEPVDLSITYIPAQHLKVVDGLLNFIAQTLAAVYGSEKPGFDWLQKLLTAVTQHSSVTHALLRRLWHLVLKQGVSLSNHHLDSLAAVLVELQLLGNKVPAMSLNKVCNGCGSHRDSSITQLLLNTVRTSSKQSMLLILRLTSSYLKYALCAHDKETDVVIIPDLAKTFSYLATRLVPELRHCPSVSQAGSLQNSDNIVVMLYRSDRVQELLETFQLSVQEWIVYETMVCPEQDAISDSDRFEYHSWVTYQWFLSRPTQAGGYGGDCMALAQTVLKALLTTQHRDVDVKRCPDCRAKDTGSVAPYSRCYIVNILQGLTSLFSAKEQQSEPPWLVKQLTECVRDTTDHIQTQRVVQDFVNVSLSLPAYLLFANTPGSLSARSPSLSSLTELIKTLMVEHLCTGIHFPSSLSAYIAQAMLQAVKPDHWSAVVELVCDKCPSVIMSFMVNSTAVSPFLQGELDCSTCIGSLMQFHRTGVPRGQLEAWHISTAVFSHIVQGTYREKTGSLDEVYRFKDHPDIDAVYNKLAEMLVLQLTYCHHFTEYKDWPQIERLQTGLEFLLSGLDTCRGVLVHLLSSPVDPRTRACVRNGCLELRYLTTVRFLCELSSAVDVRDQLDICGVTGLLQSYVDVSKILADLGESQASECLTLTELTELTESVVKLLEHVPATLLKQMEQELILSCGPGITDFVIRKITCHRDTEHVRLS